MKKYSMKLSVPILAVLIFLIISTGCKTDVPPLTSAIFSDVIKIEISPIEDLVMDPVDFFTYELPEAVKYAIVELFSVGAVFTDNPEKTVPIEYLVAGSRTGFEAQGFTRQSVQANKLFPVNAEKKDFIMPGPNFDESGFPVDYSWIVLGYDENMILTHASPEGKVQITWP